MPLRKEPKNGPLFLLTIGGFFCAAYDVETAIIITIVAVVITTTIIIIIGVPNRVKTDETT